MAGPDGAPALAMATLRQRTVTGLITRPSREAARPFDRGPAVADEIADAVRAYGTSVATVLMDPMYQRFTTQGIDGAIAYRIAGGCAVATGDPVCAPPQRLALANAFVEAAGRKNLVTVIACATEAFADEMVSQGAACIGFGSELQLDPQRDPTAGGKGRELRKKLAHARKAGLHASEYAPSMFPNIAVESELASVATQWLAARKGPQVFLSHVRLFEAPSITRYFHVRSGDRYVGVLTTVRLDRFDGYLLNHVLTTPDAPDGTSELLITHVLEVLRSEGCGYATFGPAPGPELGRIVNLSHTSERIARRVYKTCDDAFHLDARTRYRRKFQVAHEEPSFLLFAPPRVGPRQLAGLFRAFNVSLG